jgi:outer membrane protein TolC
MIKRYLVIILMLSGVMLHPGVVADDTAIVLTIDDAVERALAHNLGLAAEKIDLLIKEKTKKASFNLLIPKVSAGATLFHLNQAIEPVTAFIPSGDVGNNTYDYVTPVTVEIPDTFLFSASLSATLVISAPVFNAIKQTSIEYDMGKISYQAAQKKLERDVRKSFYAMLLSGQSLKLMEKNISTAKSRFDQASANFKAGIVDEYTMLDAQVKYENMKPALEEMRNAYQTALLAFKILINVPFDREVKFSGSISEPEPLHLDIDLLINNFLPNRLDLQNLRSALLMAENTRNMLSLSLLPSLFISWSFDPTFQGDPFAGNWFEDMGDNWKQETGMFSIGLSFSLDALLPFSKTRADLDNTKKSIEKLKLTLDQAAQAAEYEVRAIIMKLQKSKETIEKLKLNVGLAEKANMIGQEAYKAGLKDYSQIENTELGLQQAQYEILKEKYNYITGLLDLAYALNTTEDQIIETGK